MKYDGLHRAHSMRHLQNTDGIIRYGLPIISKTNHPPTEEKIFIIFYLYFFCRSYTVDSVTVLLISVNILTTSRQKPIREVIGLYLMISKDVILYKQVTNCVTMQSNMKKHLIFL